MEYTVLKLSKMAGISPRTLRYYDEIGLLKPARVSDSGYRIYGTVEIDKLQQILFYRQLGVNLATIHEILSAPSFDRLSALRDHRDELLKQKAHLDLLIRNVEKTIASTEGRFHMSNEEKFAGLKQKIVADNEKLYGEEIRKKYGDEVVNQSNAKMMGMTETEHEEAMRLEGELKEMLRSAFQTGNPSSPMAQQVAELHRRWLSYYWSQYRKEAHAGLAQMYVDDERFKAYYDVEQPGFAEFLRDAIHIYTGLKN